MPDYTTVSGFSLTDLDSVEEWSGYVWSELHLMRGSDGYLYTVAQSGCSCNGFGDYIEDGDVVRVGSWQIAALKAQQWGGLEANPTGPVMEFIARLTELRPAPFDATTATIPGEVIPCPRELT